MQHSEKQLEKLRIEEPYHFDLIMLKKKGELPELESLTKEEFKILCHDYFMPDSEIASLFGVSKDKVRKTRYSLGLKMQNRIIEDVVGMVSQYSDSTLQENKKLKEEIKLLKHQIEILKKKIEDM